jgi:hypothetical protein
MRGVLIGIVAALALGTPAYAGQCPAGSYPSVDNWGNQICKRFSDQSTATAQVPRDQQCPNGAYPTMDNFGNQVCRSFGASNQPRTDYYDTSHGCPIGTIPWVDMYGNNVCKRP